MDTPENNSLRSVQPLPEFSLGSIGSSSLLSNPEAEAEYFPQAAPRFKTQHSSTTSPTTAASSAPIATPSPPQASRTVSHKPQDATPTTLRHAMPAAFAQNDVKDSGGLEPAISDTQLNGKPRKSRLPGDKAPASTLTLREQEKTIDQLNKKIWSLQLKIHYLEERLDQSQPETHQVVARQNVALKIEVHTLESELKKCKKLTLRLEKELESLGSTVGREEELMKKLEDKDRELKEMRKSRGVMDGDESIAALHAAEDRVIDLEDHAETLETELESARQQIDDNINEMDQLRDALKRGPDGGRVSELEEVVDDLRGQLADSEDMLTRREEEREELLDELEGLRLQLEDIQRRREAEAAERSQSRAELYERQQEGQEMEEEVNALRDKLARCTLDVEMRDEELDQKEKEIEDLVDQFKEQIGAREDEWRGEVEETRAQVDELRDIVAERETEAGELRAQLADLEVNSNELHNNFEAALRHLEEKTQEKDTELDAANQEVQRLGDRVFELEDEKDQYRDETERWKNDVEAETARLDGTVVALKERLGNAKAELQDTTNLYNECLEQVAAQREKRDQLAKQTKDLVDELDGARKHQQRLQRDFDAEMQKHQDDLRKERRSLEAKETSLQSTVHELASANASLAQLRKDYEALQNAHKDAKSLGDTHVADRYSLQLEIDRLQRDSQRLEDDLKRSRQDLNDREQKIRDRETSIDRLYVENRDLTTQLAAQTQARLSVAEKLDTAQANLKAFESDLGKTKTKLQHSESALTKSQRGVAGSEAQFKDQLTERNTLLLTIYQYLDKIVGVEKGIKKGSAETKPFTNFPAFHDNLLGRLKVLSNIQLDFDRRCKEAESRYTDRLDGIKKQLDARWRQLDKFESSVSKIADQKAAWRRKYHEKDSELDLSRAAQADAAAQLSILRRAPQTDTTGMKSMTARAVNAEKRLTNAQNQLLAAEEKMLSMKDKVGSAETKWEARVREYESRIKACEEKVKRERQGAKERVGELEYANKAMQKQYDLSQRRIQQLQDLIDAKAKPSQ